TKLNRLNRLELRLTDRAARIWRIFGGERPAIPTIFKRCVRILTEHQFSTMKTLILSLILGCMSTISVRAEHVYILHDATVPQAAYAARKLGEAVKAEKHVVTSDRARYDVLISLAV